MLNFFFFAFTIANHTALDPFHFQTIRTCTASRGGVFMKTKFKAEKNK